MSSFITLSNTILLLSTSPFLSVSISLNEKDAENSLKHYRSCETIELEIRVKDEFASLKSLIIGQHAEGHKSVCIADFREFIYILFFYRFFLSFTFNYTMFELFPLFSSSFHV